MIKNSYKWHFLILSLEAEKNKNVYWESSAMAVMCDICGGELSMDVNGEFAVCKSCGMRHSKERIQAKVRKAKGATENSKGNTELERLLKNAEAYISLGKFDDAREIYDTISKEYPGDSRAWWGHFIVYVREIEKTRICDLHEISRELDYARSAIMLSPSLESEYINLEQNLMEQADKGQIHFKWAFKHFYLKEEELKASLQKLPPNDIIRCRLLLGIEDAEKLRESFKLLSSTSNEVRDKRWNMFFENLNITGMLEKNMIKNDPWVLQSSCFVAGRTIIVAPNGFSNSFLMSKNWNELRSQLPEIVAKCKEEVPERCYIATAVYGSYDCPEVWTLRRFRDQTLSATWYGRKLVRVYYATSPTLVKWFGHTVWFKKYWKKRLDFIVKKLNSKGVENIPYIDE